MIKIKTILFFCFVTIGIPTAASAQGYRGHDFWICFPQNAKSQFNQQISQSIFIASDFRTKGTVESSLDSSSMPFAVESGASITLDLDTNAQIVSNGIVERKSFHITCDHDITLYVVSHRAASTDSYIAIPTPLLGREYKVAGYAASNGFGTECAIIATENHTWVTFHYSSSGTDSVRPLRTVSLGLQKGETFQLKSKGNEDMTGTSVTADKPIAFFTGHTCAQIPANKRFCDMLLEMEAPATNFGREFAVPRFVGKDYSVIRVISNADGTEVKLNGRPVATLSNGGYYECDTLLHDATVSTSKPALVAQYATSSEADSLQIGDPFMILLVPQERYDKEYSSITVEPGTFLHFLNLIVPRSSIGSLMIDGRKLFPNGSDGKPPILPTVTATHAADAGILFESVQNLPVSDYVHVTAEITAGRHDLKCDAPFAAYAYGFGRGTNAYDSYGHSCGARLDASQR